MLRLVKPLVAGSILFIGVLIFIKSLEYYAPDFDKGYLSDKESAFHGIFKYGFYMHILAAPWILFIGTYQAWVKPSAGRKNIHKRLGIIYTLLVVCLAGPGGIVLSFYALGGLSGKISFLLLSVLWILFTAKGYVYGKENNTYLHKWYMIRSYVLALSAVFLRILLFLLAQSYLPEGMNYAAVAWLSWLPALVLTELAFAVSRPKPL